MRVVADQQTSPFYSGYRFPADVIHRAIWLYLRFTLSYRDVEYLIAERGIAQHVGRFSDELTGWRRE